ncbi:MAG TPA: MotA/TolQ/ExbB proton channel family protein [Longimicrobiaceae bacterium]|nr:MotA/TolQ/ExbB proton channel family protein [Longimicrobiaceae bacterium]
MTSSFTDASPYFWSITSADPVQASFWDQYPEAVRAVAYFLISGGFFMLLIVLCSVLAVSVVLWKVFTLRRRHVVPDDLAGVLESAEAAAAQGESGQLAAASAASDSVLGRISHLALTRNFSSQDEAAQAVESQAREEVVKLESGVALLEVVITIAPLLGLLGTVKGLVGVFSTLGAGGGIGPDPARLALGIAEALNTTIAGLAVAVPAVIAHSYFSKKIERLSVRMEVLVGKALAARFGHAPRRHAEPHFAPNP